MFRRKNSKGQRILTRIILIMLLVFFIQTSLYVGSIFNGGAFKNLDQSAIYIFEEKSAQTATSLQIEFVQRWMNIDYTVHDDIVEKIEEAFVVTGSSYQDLLNSDPDLCLEVINRVTDELLLLIRRNVVTGSFVVLNNKEEDSAKYGLHLQDSSTLVFADNSDILYGVSPYNYGNPAKLAKSSNYDTMFKFEEYKDSEKDFLRKPILAHEETLSDPLDCGWWSLPFLFTPKREVITYSIPLIGTNGDVYGVFGVDVTIQHLRRFLPHAEFSGSRFGNYILTKSTDGILHAGENVFSNHNSPINASYNGLILSDLTKANIGNNSLTYETLFGMMYLTITPLNIYNDDEVFNDETWYIISTIEHDSIHKFSSDLGNSIQLAITIAGVISVFIIVVLSTLTATPIMQLTHEIKQHNPNEALNLKKIHIREIDDLVSSIVTLNHNVRESDIKLSKIIELVDIPIIAFEYNNVQSKVFLSKDISSVLMIDGKKDYTVSEFKNLLNYLDNFVIDRSDSVSTYKYLDYTGNYRWVDIRYFTDEKNLVNTGIIVDVTKEYIEKERLIYERNYDGLTNIYNRRAFYDELERLFANPAALKDGAFIMIDLDNLKLINDNFGHDYGDEYIRITATIITQSCKLIPNYLYGRRSGDEFYIFLYGYDNRESIDNDIEIIRNQFSNSVFLTPDGTNLRVRVSVGISLFPQDASNYSDLIKFADFALYETKNSMKGEFKFFDRQSYNQNAYLLQNKEELNTLIENELVDFHFQPIVSLVDGSILGYEALMRSMLPTFKNPLEILNVARSQFKLNQIERLSFLKAMDKYKENVELFGKARLFINSVANQMMTEYDIMMMEERYGPLLQNMVMELTEHERATKSVSEQKVNLIRHWLGEVALDDYGTGYSGELTLLETQPDYVKIDMSLVRNIDTDDDRKQMVTNIISYARIRKIKTIAEGVETKGELEVLSALKCDFAQGFLLGRPKLLPEAIDEEIVSMIQEVSSKFRKRSKITESQD